MKIGLLSDTSESAFSALQMINDSSHELVLCSLKGKMNNDLLNESSFDGIRNTLISENDLYKHDVKGIDLLISYCYPSLIREPLISSPKFGCINFHPAPLPKYRGFAVYNFGILNGEKKWGVTAHCIDNRFDTGDIIKVNEFDISENETVVSLRKKSHTQMLILLNDVLDNFENLYRKKKKQTGEARYYSRKKMNEVRKIKLDDSADEIKQKIRAFWCPPHHGASMTIQGEEFTIVSSELLEKIWRKEDG
jgi:methionyl-tRNA formyltransferase